MHFFILSTKTCSRALTNLVYLSTVFFTVWIIHNGATQLGYHWQWYRIWPLLHKNGALGPLLQGAVVTLKISFYGLLGATFWALGIFFLRRAPLLSCRIIGRITLEAIRNTPLLVQIFFLYFVLGPLLDLERTTAAVLALSLFEGAYASEILRAGVDGVPKGQWEAAQSLGFSKTQVYLQVVLPQALMRILPPLTSQSVSLIKDSALVSTISIFDLTMQGQIIIAETFLTFEVWFTIALLYLICTWSLSFLASQLAHRRQR